MCKKLILSVFFVMIALDEALACNGYKAKLLKVENCAGSDAVITIDGNSSLKLNKKCQLVPDGCVTYKDFNTAVSNYKVIKDGITLKEGELDMCSLASHASDTVKEYLKLFGAPDSCPVKQSKICGNERAVDLSKYKSVLSMARGVIIIDSDIEHDTGKSCFHIELEITKG